MPPWVVLALTAAALLILVLVFLLLRARREAARLRDRLSGASQSLERLQESFSRFAPEALVERIVTSGMPTEGEKKEVTALFADLVGFTALSESVDPTVLVEILNGYFESMSRAIRDRHGFVSTFIGDGILAFFGAMEPNPWQTNDALHAALAMRAALADYNEELESKGRPRLAIGVGLHRGSGIAGLVGSRDKIEFAVAGRTVNVAARVQDLTREHGLDILLTDAVRQGLDPAFRLRALPASELRGIAEPVSIWAAEGYGEL
ncbi:MAG: adenylate/guanylate cyclase domain-containing protein [Deltaproteobacteria bacterium]|nr:adenylate/guanylate cyclase domain-containing protein [Deltaproteobacteria bacterium]